MVLIFRTVAYSKNEIDFNTCDHNKSVIQYIYIYIYIYKYICILCNLPFSIGKEIPQQTKYNKNGIDFNTCYHNKSVIQYIYMYFYVQNVAYHFR